MKRFAKVYLEISNVCNMRCSFCPGTAREKRMMREEEFSSYVSALLPYTDYLYFHLMGEPLLHPQLGRFLEIAGEAGERVILTTNGTLLPEKSSVLLAAPALHKVNISLHAFEANELSVSLEEYVSDCVSFAKQAADRGILISLRLWNRGGREELNPELLALLHNFFPGDWSPQRGGFRLADRTYLQFDEKFDWPSPDAPDHGAAGFCYGLRDQLGVLCDGTVVPCCLDGEGAIPLGNLNDASLAEILASPRAKALYDGFSARTAVEPLCRRCGYAQRFR